MVAHKNGKKVPPYRHTQTELRIRLLWLTLKAVFECLCQYVRFIWEHNPLKVLSRRHQRLYFVENYGEIMIKPKFGERVLDLLLSDYRRRQRLLNWVHGRIRSHTHVHDFSTCWQDGTALCALLESICPGVCPSYHLLSGHNRVKNCRLGLKLANKYLYVPMDLISAEEIAIANKASENKIIQYISMVKWASQNIKEKWASLHESLIAAKTGRCFAKGSGLKSGIAEKRSKFTVLVSDTIGVFNLLVEVRGPNNEYCGERIVSLHQAKALLDKSFDYDVPQSDNIKYLEDCAGNTFVRKKVPARYERGTSELIYFDIQCGEEGTFYVTFVPKMAGMHAVAVKWQNHHVENSPFRIKVYKASNVSTKNLKGAQEKRVIYDSLSFSSQSADGLEHPETVEEFVSRNGHESSRSLSAMAKAKAYSKGRQLTVTRRRVLRRIITRNGEDIVIEEAISPSLSRQSSITDNSDEDTRHQRQDKDEAGATDTHGPKSHATVLRTVPEERQGSKENDHSNSIDQSEVLKYKYTELDEHNRLDGDGYQSIPTYEHHEEENLDPPKDLNENTPDVMATLFEHQTNNTGMVAKRSILKRTSSMHHPYKTMAKRTSSDGLINKLHRGLVSFATRDLSETSSEFSSDRKQINMVEENGATSPSIKLLHSSSMKKACMYISEKAVHQTTVSSCGDDEAVTDDMEETSFPSKTKLRATQSLPIVRKYWKRDMTSEDSVKGLINCLQKINSVNSLPNLERRCSDISDTLGMDSFLANRQIQFFTTTHENDIRTETPVTSSNEIDIQNSQVEKFSKLPNLEPRNGTVFSFGIIDLKADKSNSTSPISIPENSLGITEEKATETQVPDTPSALSLRGNLTRQTTIFCQKSSVDSSSVKTDHSSDEKVSTDQSLDTKSNHFCAFRRIYIRSDEEKTKAVGNNEITLIIPKAKIDKSTQVVHSDIIRETNWDLIEGVYLLLRKISINLPSQIDDFVRNRSFPASLPDESSRVNAEEKMPSENVSADKNRLQVPLSPCHDRDYPPRRLFTGNETRPLNRPELPDQHQLLHNENHRNVHAWFERNNLLNSPNRLAPVRQFTIETVDSGFDDSNTLANYNRQGRLSLPNILSENGHVRLHRRPYRGPQIQLAASLVNSNSSQNVSLEHRETVNDADDELSTPRFPPDVSKPHTRRRHKRINRENSFSLSDSELNERRKRVRRRNFTFDHTVSRNESSSCSGHRQDFMEIIKKLLTRQPVLGKLRQEKSADRSFNLSECDLVCASGLADSKMSTSDINTEQNQTKAWKNRLGTLTSVDSNYCGFGLSKAMRSDFLSQIDSFQNLCPSEEVSDEIPPAPKITHWHDGNVFLPYNDYNTESREENDLLVSRYLSEHSECEIEAPKMSSETSVQFHATGDFPGVGTVQNDNRLKQSFESNQVAVHSTSHGTIKSSTYFDIFSSFDHSHLHGDVEPSDIAMLGDVISLATNSGEQTIFRMAGAGLRYGTVGVNNSFQVWVENPSPGSLAVTIIGPQSHSVTETSVIYTGDNLYEVSYEVAHPGKYKIFVRWGERPLSKDPYICEVSI